MATEYKVSGQTSASNPGNGFMKFNTANQNDATQLYLCDNSVGNVNVADILNQLAPGDVIEVANKAASTTTTVYTIGSVTDNSGWHTLAVTATDTAGTWPLTGSPSVLITALEPVTDIPSAPVGTLKVGQYGIDHEGNVWGGGGTEYIGKIANPGRRA